MSKLNHYEFLNIPIDADVKTILNAIEQVSQTDYNKRHESRLITIKHTLSDPTRRRAYDRLIQQTPSNKTQSFSSKDQPPTRFRQAQRSLSDPHTLNKHTASSVEDTQAASSNRQAQVLIEDSVEDAISTSDFEAHSPLDHPPPYHKDRLSAAWLAFFSLGFGVHRFWLGQKRLGLFYLFLNTITSGLLSIAGIVEGVVLYFSSDDNWQRLHADKASPYPGKDKIAAALLAFMAGSVGAHRYYLGQWQLGILYTLFSWTLIPWLIAIVEAISFLKQSDAQWNRRYGHSKNHPAGCLAVLFIPVILSVIGLGFFSLFVIMMSNK